MDVVSGQTDRYIYTHSTIVVTILMIALFFMRRCDLDLTCCVCSSLCLGLWCRHSMSVWRSLMLNLTQLNDTRHGQLCTFKNLRPQRLLCRYGPTKVAEALPQAIRLVGWPQLKLVEFFLPRTTAALTCEPQDTSCVEASPFTLLRRMQSLPSQNYQ